MLKKNINEFNNIYSLFKDNYAILTAGGKSFNSMTVSWGEIGVLWGKDVATVFVRPQRYTKEFIDKYDNFTLSFLPLEYKEKVNYFGKTSGKDVDKFEKTNLHPIYDVDFDATYIGEAMYVLKMKKIYVDKIKPEGFIDSELMKNYPNSDYHFVYIGEIKQFLVNEE